MNLYELLRQKAPHGEIYLVDENENFFALCEDRLVAAGEQCNFEMIINTYEMMPDGQSVTVNDQLFDIYTKI